eukprot:m.358669 g.358669  ORF g.358669 m.358669 type:complete len:115 (-) comp19947_c0_seq6:322-666(-)
MYITMWHGARITNQFPDDGVNVLVKSLAVINSPAEIARMLKGARHIHPGAVGAYLREKPEETKEFLLLHDMSGLSLTQAARCMFRTMHMQRPSSKKTHNTRAAVPQVYHVLRLG